MSHHTTHSARLHALAAALCALLLRKVRRKVAAPRLAYGDLAGTGFAIALGRLPEGVPHALLEGGGVPDLLLPDASLYLDAAPRALDRALALLAGWGLRLGATFVLQTPQAGDRYTLGHVRLVLVGEKGSGYPPHPGEREHGVLEPGYSALVLLERLYPGVRKLALWEEADGREWVGAPLLALGTMGTPAGGRGWPRPARGCGSIAAWGVGAMRDGDGGPFTVTGNMRYHLPGLDGRVLRQGDGGPQSTEQVFWQERMRKEDET